MAIERTRYEQMMRDMKVGNSVAEYDFLLESARVETPIFDDVMNDNYDIIFGRKGAGKTAMFKIINNLSDFLLQHQNTVILSGSRSHNLESHRHHSLRQGLGYLSR